MPDKKKKKSLRERLKEEWNSYLGNCGKDLNEPRSFKKYLFIGPKLLGHIIVHSLFVVMVLFAALTGQDFQDRDREVD